MKNEAKSGNTTNVNGPRDNDRQYHSSAPHASNTGSEHVDKAEMKDGKPVYHKNSDHPDFDAKGAKANKAESES